jgi:hypothetical protein
LTYNKSSTDYSSKDKDYKAKYENKKRKLRECRIEIEKLRNEIEIIKSNEKIKSNSFQNINIHYDKEREMIDLIKNLENEVNFYKIENNIRR